MMVYWVKLDIYYTGHNESGIPIIRKLGEKPISLHLGNMPSSGDVLTFPSCEFGCNNTYRVIDVTLNYFKKGEVYLPAEPIHIAVEKI